MIIRKENICVNGISLVKTVTTWGPYYGPKAENSNFCVYYTLPSNETCSVTYHRDNEPAHITFFLCGSPSVITYYHYGRLHREDGPAIIERDHPRAPWVVRYYLFDQYITEGEYRLHCLATNNMKGLTATFSISGDK